MKDKQITKKIAILYWSNRKLFTEKFSPHQIGPGQGAFLICLEEKNEIRQEKLVSLIGVDKARGTRVIRKLIEAGSVRRRRDPSDHRAYLISLTAEGAVKKLVILEAVALINKTLFQGFTEEERDMALQLLDRMIQNTGWIPASDADETEE